MCPGETVEVEVEVTNEDVIAKKVVEEIQPSKCRCNMYSRLAMAYVSRGGSGSRNGGYR